MQAEIKSTMKVKMKAKMNARVKPKMKATTKDKMKAKMNATVFSWTCLDYYDFVKLYDLVWICVNVFLIC